MSVTEALVGTHRFSVRQACVVLWCALAPTTVLALPGFANLINGYCRDQGAQRVRYTDDGCTLCHHASTFTSDPVHRVEPVWSEFELGRSSGEYRFFCPGPTNTGAAITSADLASPVALPAPTAGGPVSHAEMPWMSLGYPTGHTTTENLDTTGQPEPSKSPSAARAVPPPAAAQDASVASSAAEKTKRQLDKLRKDLGISAAQQSVWVELQDAVLAARANQDARVLQPDAATPALSERLEAQQRPHALRIAQLRAVNTATVRLNAQLNERQQRLLAVRLPPLIDEP